MEKLVESMYCMYNEQIEMRLTNEKEKRQDFDDLIFFKSIYEIHVNISPKELSFFSANSDFLILKYVVDLSSFNL